MSLKPQEDIGVEIHTVDQFFRVEEGSGEAELNGLRMPIQAGTGSGLAIQNTSMAKLLNRSLPVGTKT